MGAIGLNIIVCMYCLSIMTFVADVALFEPLGITPRGLSGDVVDTEALRQASGQHVSGLRDETLNPTAEGDAIDRIVNFSTGGFTAVWSILSLFTGSYYLHWVEAVGVPSIVIFVFQAIFPFAVALTVIKYIRGIQ